MHIKNFNTTNELKGKGYRNIISLIVVLFLLAIQSLSIDKLSFLSVPFLLLMIFILVLNIMLLGIRIHLLEGHLWLILCFFMMLFSVLVSDNFSNSIQYFSYYVLFGIILIILSNTIGWHSICLKTQLVFSMTHAIITIISVFLPIVYYALVLPMYSTINQNLIVYWMQNNSYPGIAGQLGTNSFLITLGIAIVFANIFSKKSQKGKIQIIFLLILIAALFLTGKRGMLIGNIIAALVTWYVGPLSLKKTRIFNILLASAIVVITIYILSGFIPALEQTLGRFVNNGDDTDFSSGRFELYEGALQLFKEYYLFGSGIGTYTSLSNGEIDTSLGAHNDLLQMMVETGFIGSVIYFIPIIWVLNRTFKLIRMAYRNQYGHEFYKYRPYLLASLYIQIIILFYSMIGNPFHYYNMLFIYMIFAAIPMGVELAFKRKEQNR
ncbi:O-antigen ligase family protein [Peribacillus asahii]|nr:O-antigen ligase family protein [Peribacillus asahii]